MSYMRNGVYEVLRPFIASLRDGSLVTLGGGSGLLASAHDSVDCRITNYPDVDAHATGFNDNRFDFVLLDFVLEHTRRPWQVIEEVHRIVSQLAIVTLPCFYRYHPNPIDAWRFMPDSVPVLFEKFESVLSGTCGNRKLIAHYATHGLGTPPPPQVMKRHQDRWPVLMWVVAFKTQEARGRYQSTLEK